MPKLELTEKEIVEHTENWIRNLVLEHNLCPFAHQPFHNGLIRFAVSWATVAEDIVDDLINELLDLNKCDAKAIETTLLITPYCFSQFEQYNAFLDVADAINEQLELTGILQIASFHPDYQFEGLPSNDVKNYTNRSIYPMFHLIREKSISKTQNAHIDIDSIPNKNMELLDQIGLETIQAQRTLCTQSEKKEKPSNKPK